MNGVAKRIKPPQLPILEGRPFWLADPLQTPSHPRYHLLPLILILFSHPLLATLLSFNLIFYLLSLIFLIHIEMSNLRLLFTVTQ